MKKMRTFIYIFSFVFPNLIFSQTNNQTNEGFFEKTQTFRAIAFGPRDETCTIVAEDIANQMEDAETAILKMDGLIISKMIDPCLFSEGMQTSMFGEIVYLIPETETAEE